MKKRVLLLLTALFAFTPSAQAQTSRGTVSGVVTDPNNAVVAGAEVTVTNAETTVSRSTVTNGEASTDWRPLTPATIPSRSRRPASAP